MSFVLLADCAALHVHGMNILHLSDVPDVIEPRLAIEAVILLSGFGLLVGVVMPFVLIIANAVVIETCRTIVDSFRDMVRSRLATVPTRLR
jgi:hypothetical protein